MARPRKFRKRENGEGTFFRDKNGYFCWRMKVGDQLLTVKAKTAEERDEKKAARLKELEARGGTLASGMDRSRTVGEYLDWWLENIVKPPNKAHKTWRGYEQVIRLYVKPAVGSQRLEKLTSLMVREMVNGLTSPEREGGPLSPRTGGYALSILKKALQDAMNEKPPVITINVAAPVKPPKLGPRRKRTLRPAAISEVFSKSAMAGRYGPVIALILSTGVRTSEALGWQWDDYDPDAEPRPVIRVLRKLEWLEPPRDALGRKIGDAPWGFADVKKTMSRRTIPLGTLAVEALRQIRAQQEIDRELLGDHYTDHGLILTTEKGGPVNHRNLQRALDALLKKAGLPHLSLHDLRKTNGSHMARQGVPMHVVQRLLGHEQITTTEKHYLDALADDMADAATAFDAPTS